jgi:hypothetical protein
VKLSGIPNSIIQCTHTEEQTALMKWMKMREFTYSSGLHGNSAFAVTGTISVIDSLSFHSTYELAEVLLQIVMPNS